MFNHLQLPIYKWIKLRAICIPFAKIIYYIMFLNTMPIPIQMHPAWSYTIIARTSIKVDGVAAALGSVQLAAAIQLPTAEHSSGHPGSNATQAKADFPSWQTICQGHYPFANTAGRNGGLRNKCDTKKIVPVLLVYDACDLSGFPKDIVCIYIYIYVYIYIYIIYMCVCNFSREVKLVPALHLLKPDI